MLFDLTLDLHTVLSAVTKATATLQRNNNHTHTHRCEMKQKQKQINKLLDLLACSQNIYFNVEILARTEE